MRLKVMLKDCEMTYEQLSLGIWREFLFSILYEPCNTEKKVGFAAKLLSNHYCLNEVPFEGKTTSKFMYPAITDKSKGKQRLFN